MKNEMRNTLLTMLALLLMSTLVMAASTETKHSEPFRLYYGWQDFGKRVNLTGDPDAGYVRLRFLDVDNDNGGDAADGPYFTWSTGTDEQFAMMSDLSGFGTGTMDDWTVSATQGVAQVISDGETLDFASGSGGIDTQVSATPSTITIAFDPSEVDTPTWGAGSDFTWVFDGTGSNSELTFSTNRISVGVGDVLGINGGGSDFATPVDGDLYYRTDTDLFRLRANGAWRTMLDSAAIGATVQAWDADLDTWATKTAPSGTVVGTTDTQALSAKTLTDPLINASRHATRTLTTATETLTGTDDIVFCSYNAGTMTLNLPAAASHTGRIYRLHNLALAQSVSIVPNGVERLNNATPYSFAANAGISITSNGSNWYTI